MSKLFKEKNVYGFSGALQAILSLQSEGYTIDQGQCRPVTQGMQPLYHIVGFKDVSDEDALEATEKLAKSKASFQDPEDLPFSEPEQDEDEDGSSAEDIFGAGTEGKAELLAELDKLTRKADLLEFAQKNNFELPEGMNMPAAIKKFMKVALEG